jgi:hypothetical protein
VSGGDTSSGSSQTSNRVYVPKWLRSDIQGTVTGAEGQEQAAQSGLPSISALYGQIPDEGVAPLTSAQLGTINNYTALGTGGPNAAETAGLGTLGQYANGPIGSDPAVTAANQAYSQLTGPAAASASALQGQGNSGAAQEAQALGRSSTLQSALNTAEGNQLSAGEQLFGAGQGLSNQSLETMAAQLQAEGLPQQTAQQIATNLYTQQQQQVQYASGVQQQPLGIVPSLLGSNSTTVQTGTTTQGK